MKNRKWALLAILFTLVLVLSACVGEKKSEKVQKENEKTKEEVKKTAFPLVMKNDGEAIKGGTLNVALVTDSPFQGVFTDMLSEDAYDLEIMKFASNNIFSTDGDYLVKEGGIASLDVDVDNKKATIKIRDGVKWSDGEPLKVEDIMFPYQIIGHKDYTGVRYDTDAKNIVGMEEYHAGKADTISGLKKVDDSTLEISFKKVSPAIYTAVGDGLLYYAEPSHYLKDVPVKDLINSDKIRKNPLTLGAFKIERIVNGESVQFAANENYWKGKPKIDKVVLKTVPSTSIVAALKAGEYDFALSMPTDIYSTYKDLDNITILGRPEMSYSYLGFNLGTYDKKNGVSVMNPDAKMNDVKLRQAMAYAMNLEEVNTQFYLGLRERANSLIPPAFKTYYDSSLKGYNYDPEKAKKLLDEAGYKDTDGDGTREDKNGKPLEIKMASMSGGDNAEPIAQFYIQNWKDVGLKVTLSTGRLIEFNSFYDKVQANDKEIDIYMAAWATGTNPSPIGLYGKEAEFNMSRFTSDENDDLLAAIDSPKAMDPSYRAEAFKKWQEYMAQQVPVVPTQFRTELFPVNNRVKGVDITPGVDDNYHEWELTAETAVK
ncbi:MULTISPECIES: oligopeptide ABC transporter substrate-binding protein [Bacillus]|uniref:oligopeptide ABC transporter substrate-binding protein n=1 Tax=Bacillus TaxID=1386 RepID=UPI0002D46F29|nr:MULTISPECIES: oligopeptide ABC transporter substrate-binding protein [Bacillus]